MSCKPIGLYVECPESQALIELFGDRLEALTANDKLGIIAALALWLSDDGGEWDIPAIAHTNLFPESEDFSRAASILEDIKPDDALGLMMALTEQIRAGVHAG